MRRRYGDVTGLDPIVCFGDLLCRRVVGHERIDDGYPNFVNNDHCLLSARATINLAKMVPERLAMLPMAQTIWYIPSGLDIWNQKMDKAPGHYTRARGNLGAIEKHSGPIRSWAGASAGSLISAVRAAGYSHERAVDLVLEGIGALFGQCER